MKKYLKKFKGIFCLVMCLCMALATFQVRVFAEGETGTIHTSLSTGNKGVWGTGIITGTLDDLTEDEKGLCWDKDKDTNRGYDNATDNDIIRSFDTITYQVDTSLTNLSKDKAHTLTYQLILPNDSELALSDTSAITESQSIPKSSDIGNGEKMYAMTISIPNDHDFSAGGLIDTFAVKVGAKAQGYQVQPKIYVYLDGNESSKVEVNNIEPVTVTTAPFYNVVLAKKSITHNKDIYDFSKSVYKENAKDYSYSVTGYEETYGVALEIRKPAGGIKGVELPDPTKDFTFTINLANYKFGDKDLISEGFIPLLYDDFENKAGGAIGDIPFSNSDAAIGAIDNPKDKHCLNSGNYEFTQVGTQLTVKVKGFEIDESQFPKENANGVSYWQNAARILEGVFSTRLFRVIYPYQNASGNKLDENTTGGTVNFSAKVASMNATSAAQNTTENDTNSVDNEQSDSFSLSVGGTRKHDIYYSSRSDWTREYTPAMKWSDGDIAPAGADDLAFTIHYSQNNVGKSEPIDSIPVGIDQLVLFDNNAIDDITFSNARRDFGYEYHIKYVKYKDGKLDNQTMKTADISKFEYYDEAPSNGYAGVLIQYRGCFTTDGTDISLIAQFKANVKPNVQTDSVYMITAVTKVWDTKALNNKQQEVLNNSGKTKVDDLTRKDWQSWVLAQDGKYNDHFFDENTPETIDNRDYYTVPTYSDGVYTVDVDNHKFSTHSADGLYIVPYTTTVTKSVAQLDNENQPKEKFNIDNKQRYVDYVVNGSVRYWNNVTPPTGTTTTVYFEDVLSDGLTYVDGSAYWGGEYESKLPKKGTVTGGQQIEPTITINEKGKTVLKWEISGVELKNGAMLPLHYTCKIGDEDNLSNDVKNSDILDNEVKIHTTEDQRPYLAVYKNVSSASISILRREGFFLTKTADPLLELQDTGNFDLIISNVSATPKSDCVAVDTMPQDGYNGTVMKGTYKIEEVSLDKSTLDDVSDVKLWYTNDDEFAEKKIDDISLNEIKTKWHEATIKNEDDDRVYYDGEGLIGAWPKAIAYYDRNLNGYRTVKLNIKYKSDAAASGDKLSNLLTMMNNGNLLEAKANVEIVKRSLEGTVWLDKDKDGKIGDAKDEKRFSNVKVTILKKNGDNYEPFEAYEEVVKDGNGYKTISHPTTVTTDENGYYKFEGLPEGDFKVVFESENGNDYKDLSNFDVTQSGLDKENSKVKEENVDKDGEILKSGSILDINMPSKEDIVKNSDDHYSYNLPYQNLGLTIPSIIISGEKHWDDQDNYDGLRPDNITLQIKNGNDVVKEMKVKESDNWKWSVELPKYDDQENENHYTVIEKAVNGYESIVSSDSYDITNKHKVTKLTIPVTKVWNDNDNNDKIRPEKVIVHLYANNKDTGKTVELSEDNQWNASFDDLDQYEKGKEIIYTVVEDEVKGYQVGITGSQDTGYILTNTHGLDTVEIKGTKTWDDHNDQDKMRPSKITVRLFADGQEIALKEVTKDSKWIYDLGNLVKYKDGKEINYEVKEDVVEGYTTSIKGFDITNSHTPIPSKPSTDTPSNGNKTPEVKGKTEVTNKQQTNKIKTGDDTHLMLYVLFVVLSFMGILFLKKSK